MRIGLMQWDAGSPADGTDVQAAAAAAAAAGCGLLVLPELADVHYDLTRVQSTVSGLARLQHAARSHRLPIAGGVVRAEAERRYNALACVDARGQIGALYDKIHLFPGGVADETAMFTPGDTPRIWSLDGTQIGLSICFDVRFPGLFRRLAENGATVILTVAAWPEARRSDWRVLCRARALENQVFLVGVTYCGGRPGSSRFSGHSLVVDPSGQIQVEASADQAGLLVADLDLEAVPHVRQQFPVVARW